MATLSLTPFSKGLVPFNSRYNLTCIAAPLRRNTISLPSRKCRLNHRACSSFINFATSEVSGSQVGLEEDDEACELVSGAELILGEGMDSFRAYLLKAVKNNNGRGILLLTDIYGFEDSCTRDFAYRVSCSGYNILRKKLQASRIWRHGTLRISGRYSTHSRGVDPNKEVNNQTTQDPGFFRKRDVLVPDLFRGDPWIKDSPRTEFDNWLSRQPRERVAKDIAGSVKWMTDEFAAAGISEKFGIIGFCFGGGRLIETLASDCDAYFGTGVCFYGTRINTALADSIKVPVMFVSGENDPLCLVGTLRELEKRISGSRVVIYPGQGHGFAHRPESPEEDEDAEDAFTLMRNWLHNGLFVNN